MPQRLTIDLSDVENADLQLLANDLGQTKVQTVRQALRAYRILRQYIKMGDKVQVVSKGRKVTAEVLFL